jgi:hypothetical protein
MCQTPHGFATGFSPATSVVDPEPRAHVSSAATFLLGLSVISAQEFHLFARVVRYYIGKHRLFCE